MRQTHSVFPKSAQGLVGVGSNDAEGAEIHTEARFYFLHISPGFSHVLAGLRD